MIRLGKVSKTYRVDGETVHALPAIDLAAAKGRVPLTFTMEGAALGFLGGAIGGGLGWLLGQGCE